MSGMSITIIITIVINALIGRSNPLTHYTYNYRDKMDNDWLQMVALVEHDWSINITDRISKYSTSIDFQAFWYNWPC